MSAGGAFGGSRGAAAKAPEKGVFPLDHFGECKQIKEEYMRCLSEADSHAEKCTAIAKQYLQCRMDKNLMAKQEFTELGLEGVFNPEGIQAKPGQTRQRGASGFVAGVRMDSGKLSSESPK